MEGAAAGVTIVVGIVVSVLTVRLHRIRENSKFRNILFAMAENLPCFVCNKIHHTKKEQEMK